MEFLTDNLAPIMFGSLIFFLLSGFPVAFSLAANGILFALIGHELGLLDFVLLQAIPERIYGIMQNDTLLAIPFFTFMGIILQRSGMAEDLLESAGQLFGRVPGGLGYAVILVGALLAATTGVVAASVISMGLISLPVMMRYKYHYPTAAGLLTGAGSLAQIIPPSLVLIVLADVLSVSVKDAYTGALFPALMVVSFLLIYMFVLSIVKPSMVPPLPEDARTLRGSELYISILTAMLPPVILIFLVLGTIFIGWATPTEGGAMGAVGALLLSILRRRLTWDVVKGALDSTAKLSTFVMFILVGSSIFALSFRAINGDLWIEHLFSFIPGGEMGFVLFVSVIVFILGFFIDFFEIAFILMPLIGPVAQNMGIDMIWFLVLVGLNMSMSFLTPPFGFALFYLRSVAPKDDYQDAVTGENIHGMKTQEIYKGAIPFILIMLLSLTLIFLFPEIVTYNLDPPLDVDLDTISISLDGDSWADDTGGDGAGGESGGDNWGASDPWK
ncbi:TRAP transporter large permease subunit [Marinobacterium sp. LSUCC0821]|jgi:tripartite ATP-independent transporter DctM subunit|uniref:TRAP transporter large permease n=1 Tax=Marinobacterium sp. LSUCC0821 TaxID=2668067 RepID=UPI0014529D11|nr:TRAP transporter large permease subunit [Marinobacterium sp. LSUCC0821]QJD71854.1 TRAP transporter large permease subunit [Marinobacterium sp. LSUCC0821]